MEVVNYPGDRMPFKTMFEGHKRILYACIGLNLGQNLIICYLTKNIGRGTLGIINNDGTYFLIYLETLVH